MLAQLVRLSYLAPINSPRLTRVTTRSFYDNKSNIIIPKVFDYLLHTNRFSGAMIGVMGTNGMRQTYQVIFSQTINQYARICYKDKQNPLTHLLISIRESDYSKWGMSLSQLGNYVRTCAKYYS